MSPIVKAACREGTRIWVGRRHGEIIKQMVDDGAKTPVTSAQQGFVDSEGTFLSREVAYDRAVLCHQIQDIRKDKLLLSEMLW